MRSLREYMVNSSIHGLKYITQDERHWSERLFWLVCCCISLWGTASIVKATWHSFQTEAISFVVDTNYPEWNTTFPALTVCQEESYEQTEDFQRRRNLSDDETGSEMMIMYQEIVFFSGICDKCSEEKDGWPKANEFLGLTIDFLKSCVSLLTKCSWNGKPFECCTKFHPIRTELGYCYAVNSLQTIKAPRKDNMLVANREVGVGSLEFGVTSPVKVHQHGPQDVPTPTTISDAETWFAVQEGEIMERTFSVKETYNEPEVRDLSEAQRRCLFLDENRSDSIYRYYSFSTCQVDCRMRLTKYLCNCTVHLMKDDTKPGPPICDHKGLSCISANSGLIKEMRTSVDDATNSFGCFCLPSCTDPELKLVWEPTSNLPNDEDFTLIRVKMTSLPTERLLRIVVRGKLDLVVAAGGTVGLFLGASLLSSIEFLYYVGIRPLSDKIRHAWRRRNVSQ